MSQFTQMSNYIQMSREKFVFFDYIKRKRLTPKNQIGYNIINIPFEISVIRNS